MTNLAFSIPTDGTIKDFAVHFTVTPEGNLFDATQTINAQLYRAEVGTSDFFAIPETFLELTPSFTGVVPQGSIASGILRNLSIPVAAEERLLLVISATSEGTTDSTNLIGNVSAGLSFVPNAEI